MKLQILSLIITSSLAAQSGNFTSGSTGQDGDLIVPINTTINLPLPDDGVFNYRNIIIGNNATVRFLENVNQLNPPVYLLASGFVQNDGTIDVSGESSALQYTPGRGGPGGFDGGYGAFAEGVQGVPGDGKGPGGGRGGQNSSNPAEPGRFSYGNALCSPLIGGAGGGGGIRSGTLYGTGGGGGGGALLIAANTAITNNGTISARGGTAYAPNNFYWPGGFGSGGAIRLVAPLVVGTTRAVVDVSGSTGGRTRIDSNNRQLASTIHTTPANAVSITRGSQMFVFPPNNRLEIVRVAGDGFSEVVNAGHGAFITLQPGPNVSNATVRVRATGSFYNLTNIPISVVVTPENGPRLTSEASIVLSNGAGTADLPVTLFSGTSSFIHAWTR